MVAEANIVPSKGSQYRTGWEVFLDRPLGRSYTTLLSVVCLSSVTTWYRFETVQHSGLKFYWMVEKDAGSYGVERHPKRRTVSVQWRLQWGCPSFRVDRDRLTGHIFGSIARRKRRTAKIMAPYYRQLFMGTPMAQSSANPVVRGGRP